MIVEIRSSEFIQLAVKANIIQKPKVDGITRAQNKQETTTNIAQTHILKRFNTISNSMVFHFMCSRYVISYVYKKKT